MSLVTFTLTEQHLKLLKFLRWSINDKGFIVGTEDEIEDPAPFGENNLYEAIDLILNGMPEDFDPFNTEDIKVYSDEQKAEWDKLYSELPMALDIVLFNGHFELNTYATQYAMLTSTNDDLVVFQTDINSGNIRVLAQTTSATTVANIRLSGITYTSV